ncbi:MAG: tRNA pseudouridine(55) synthase TruB [Actinomycetota bacterium]
MLIIMLNRATKLSPYFLSLDKEYEVGIRLGVVTDTWDMSGKILEEKSPPSYSPETIKRTIEQFKGSQYQTPPIYSALKHKGRPLYAYAREGKKIEVEKRKISIYHIEVLGYGGNTISLKVSCSSGTYVRWLAHAAGQKLGCGAAVGSLTRTRIGKFKASAAISSDDIKDCFMDAVLDIERALPGAANITVGNKYKKSIKNGHWLIPEMVDSRASEVAKLKPGDIVKVRDGEGELLAVHLVAEEPGEGPGLSKPIVII